MVWIKNFKQWQGKVLPWYAIAIYFLWLSLSYFFTANRGTVPVSELPCPCTEAEGRVWPIWAPLIYHQHDHSDLEQFLILRSWLTTNLDVPRQNWVLASRVRRLPRPYHNSGLHRAQVSNTDLSFTPERVFLLEMKLVYQHFRFNQKSKVLQP